MHLRLSFLQSSKTVSYVFRFVIPHKNLLIRTEASQDEMLSGCIDFSLSGSSGAPQWPVVVAGCHDSVDGAVASLVDSGAAPCGSRSSAAVEMLM